MIGDKYIFKPEDTKKAEQILNYISDKLINKKRLIIAIGGESGTSKSEVAILLRGLLKNNLNKSSLILHADDYYKVHFNYRNEVRKNSNIVGKDEYNWTKINDILISFKCGTDKLYTQEIDIFIGDTIYHIIPTDNIDIIIFEGLYACYTANCDLKIYMEGTIAETYNFRKERAKENPDSEFRKWVVEKESACVRQSKKYANLIIPFKI